MNDRPVLDEINLERLLKDDPHAREQLRILVDQSYERLLDRQSDTWGSRPEMPLSSGPLWKELLHALGCA